MTDFSLVYLSWVCISKALLKEETWKVQPLSHAQFRYSLVPCGQPKAVPFAKPGASVTPAGGGSVCSHTAEKEAKAARDLVLRCGSPGRPSAKNASTGGLEVSFLRCLHKQKSDLFSSPTTLLHVSACRAMYNKCFLSNSFFQNS